VNIPIFLETKVIVLHFSTDSRGSIFIQIFLQWTLKDASLLQESANPFKVIQVPRSVILVPIESVKSWETFKFSLKISGGIFRKRFYPKAVMPPDAVVRFPDGGIRRDKLLIEQHDIRHLSTRCWRVFKHSNYANTHREPASRQSELGRREFDRTPAVTHRHHRIPPKWRYRSLSETMPRVRTCCICLPHGGVAERRAFDRSPGRSATDAVVL